MKFRGTRDNTERQAVARDYSETVDRLIQSGRWREMPPPEDQLPDGWMPAAIFEYWSRGQGTPYVASAATTSEFSTATFSLVPPHQFWRNL